MTTNAGDDPMPNDSMTTPAPTLGTIALDGEACAVTSLSNSGPPWTAPRWTSTPTSTAMAAILVP